MSHENCYAVIMAGGKGERFWPLSTSRHPKQTLSIVGGKPLIMQAIERLQGLIPPDRILLVTSEALVGPLREAAPELPAANVIGEPVGRDTAAACALGTTIVRRRCPDGIVCVLTADHVIHDTPLFQRTLRGAIAIAESSDAIVTMGIAPTFPSTGFGYIECGSTQETRDGIEFFAARRFVEKPDAERAAAYIASGRHFWNSGMFVWSVPTFMRALRRFQPRLLALCDRLDAHVDGPGFAAALAEAYAGIEKISVDFAVMEPSDNIVVARGEFPWFDVGSWPALTDHFPPDADGNCIVGDCRTMDATGNIVVSEGRLTALIGVSDLVVVQAEHATLVCRRDQAQAVKQMVQRLAAEGGRDALL